MIFTDERYARLRTLLERLEVVGAAAVLRPITEHMSTPEGGASPDINLLDRVMHLHGVKTVPEKTQNVNVNAVEGVRTTLSLDVTDFVTRHAGSLPTPEETPTGQPGNQTREGVIHESESNHPVQPSNPVGGDGEAAGGPRANPAAGGSEEDIW